MRYALLFIVMIWCGQSIGMDDDDGALNPLFGNFPEGMVGLTPAANTHHWGSLPSDSDDDDNGITPTTSVFARVRTDIVQPEEITVSRDERVRAHSGIIFDDKETYKQLMHRYRNIVACQHTQENVKSYFRDLMMHLEREKNNQLFAYDQLRQSVLYGCKNQLIFDDLRGDYPRSLTKDDANMLPPYPEYTAYSVWNQDSRYGREYYVLAADTELKLHAWTVPERFDEERDYYCISDLPGEVHAIRYVHDSAAVVFYQDENNKDRAGIASYRETPGQDHDGGIYYLREWQFDPLHAEGVTDVICTGRDEYSAIVANRAACNYVTRHDGRGPIYMPGDEGTFC